MIATSVGFTVRAAGRSSGGFLLDGGCRGAAGAGMGLDERR